MIFKENLEKYLKESCLISNENNLITRPSGNNGVHAVLLESHAANDLSRLPREIFVGISKKANDCYQRVW